MVPNSTAPYVAKDGTRKVYCSYNCPRRRSGACDNAKSVKEVWLRKEVFGKIKDRLFLTDDDVTKFIEETKRMVEEETALRRVDAESHVPVLQAELAKLKQDIDGWRVTLADPDLHRGMRQHILCDSGAACERVDEIELIHFRKPPALLVSTH